MEQSIARIANTFADKPETIQTLLKSGEVKETKNGQKYLVIN
jgi:hypothetical protein